MTSRITEAGVAPTSSLPEAISGERNWDYRYSWIRDAAFAVYALNRIGCPEEAAGFLGWALDAVERGGRPRVLYDLNGALPSPEQIDEAAKWRAAADEIRAAILDEAWDEKLNSLTERLGGGGLDASLLCLPLRRVIPADHPKMVANAASMAATDAGLPAESEVAVKGKSTVF